MKKLFNTIIGYILAALIYPLYALGARQSCALMPQTYPTLDDMAKGLAVDTNAIEIIRQPIYDYNIYPTAGVIQLPFFAFGQGAGVSASPGVVAGSGKNLTDTNMVQGGTFPAPQAFWCESIEVDIQPGSSGAANTFALQVPAAFAVAAAATLQAGAHDVNALRLSGVLSFSISQKVYYREGPLIRFPHRHDMHLDTGVASSSATVGETVKEKMNCVGELVKLNPGIGIMTSQNFSVLLNWPVVVATPSTFNARIGVILGGWLFRGVQ